MLSIEEEYVGPLVLSSLTYVGRKGMHKWSTNLAHAKFMLIAFNSLIQTYFSYTLYLYNDKIYNYTSSNSSNRNGTSRSSGSVGQYLQGFYQKWNTEAGQKRSKMLAHEHYRDTGNLILERRPLPAVRKI